MKKKLQYTVTPFGIYLCSNNEVNILTEVGVFMYSKVYDYIELCKDERFTGFDDGRIIQNIILPDDGEYHVCLTFDDGPNPEYTPQILDLLKAYDAKATFFIFGRFAEVYPEIVRRIVREHHEIGNHTYSHPTLTSLDLSEVEREIFEGEKAIQSAVEYRCRLFRPPYGIFSDEIVEKVQELNYEFMLWSRDMQVNDWELPGTDRMVDEIISNVKNGSVILMHDAGGNRDQTVETVAKVLPILKSLNYKFTTLSELMNSRIRG